MSVLETCKKFYARWLGKVNKNKWDQDFTTLLRISGKEDPFDQQGIELALFHIQRIRIKELDVSQRRQSMVYTSTVNVDELMSQLALSKTLVVSRHSMPEVFSRNEYRHRSFDDYFVSHEGHTISIERITASIEGRLAQLFSTLGELEVNEAPEYAYYLRKLKPMFRDVFYVLQGIHTASCS